MRLFECGGGDAAARGLSAGVAVLGRARARSWASATPRSPATARSSPTTATPTTAAQAAREIERAAVAPVRPAPAAVAAARRELPATIVARRAAGQRAAHPRLLAAGLYDDAIAELRRAQATAARRRSSRRRSRTR